MMFDKPRFEVGWYQQTTLLLRAKVAQFPGGTVFGWCTDREGRGELDDTAAHNMLEQVRAIVESQGFGFAHDPPLGVCATDQISPGFWSQALAAIKDFF